MLYTQQPNTVEECDKIIAECKKAVARCVVSDSKLIFMRTIRSLVKRKYELGGR